ncbi:hypothetical protein B7C52_16435 [Escherichia coli]|nr:hypothetical protein B7C52_16435 [Escherichia coli]
MTVRYYISSADLTAEKFATAIRNHWHVENKLHWRLTCSLIFMADFGESRYFKPAKIAMNKNNLIIRTSDVEIAFKITK